MTTPYSNNTPVNPDPELTLGDVVTFVIKAKWFALAGIAIGIIVAIAYLTITPSIYESRIVIQIQPTSGNVALNQITISSDELLERLTFSQTANQVLQLMQPKPNAQAESVVRDTLKSASITKGGIFLHLTVKEHSPMAAEELGKELGNATIALISKLNAPKIAYLKKLLDSNKALLASGSQKVDIAGLQTSTLGLEALLGSPESLQPQLVDGPSFSASAVSPKSRPILLLGALLGLLTGLLWFYYKEKASTGLGN
jgi:hypothetical protein